MTPTPTSQAGHSIRVPVLWGLAFGVIQAASPLAMRWLDQATVQALLLALIAAVYIGFAVADGRPKVIAVESSIAAAFVLLAAAGVTGPAWLLVLGYAGHGLKDFWQERSHYVAGTRWWPPFCAAAITESTSRATIFIGSVSERSETEGTISLNWGQWTMRAFPGLLAIRAEAADEKSLRRIQDLLTARLQKFGRREHLTVTWRHPEAAEAEPGG